jgi:hypothetical protein
MAEDTPSLPYASSVKIPNPNPSVANLKLIVLSIVNPSIAKLRVVELLYRWFTALVSDKRGARESVRSSGDGNSCDCKSIAEES